MDCSLPSAKDAGLADFTTPAGRPDGLTIPLPVQIDGGAHAWVAQTRHLDTHPLVEPNYIWNDFDKMTVFKPAVQLR